MILADGGERYTESCVVTYDMLVTFATFQLSRVELNSLAQWNIYLWEGKKGE